MEYGLLGEKLGHSYSPLIHRVLGGYDYRLCPVSTEELDRLLRSRDFKGLNVTIPYKKTVIPYADSVSPAVRQVGSANTLFIRDGLLYADNTDLMGFQEMLGRAGITLKGKKAVILGSGGTSLTARAACELGGAREIVTVSRKGPVDYDAMYRSHTDAEVLINATPVGMYPNNLVSPVDLSAFKALSGVADVIYNPCRTALILDAIDRGIPHTDGLIMLVAQAWHASALFMGRYPDREKLAEAYRAVRADTLSVVLVGMPGSGKTTLGAMVAEALGREAIDLDREIEKAAGMTIPEIFAQKGEKAFRDLESELIRDKCKLSGKVISTGGGAVMRDENIRAIRQNSLVVQIKRPVELLPTDGRPLSKDTDRLRRMESERAPFYARCADAAIDNLGTPREAADKILEVFYEAVGLERA